MYDARCPGDCAEGRRIALGCVRGDPLPPHACLVNRPLKERLRRLGVPPLREVGVNHLPILINCAVDIRPASLRRNICLVNAPFPTNWLSVSTGSLLEQREEALNPAIDGAAVNDEPTFGEPLDDVGVTQSISDVPAHGQRDYIIREAVVREGTCRASREPASAVVAAPAVSTQPRRSILPCPLAPTPDALHGQPLSRI